MARTIDEILEKLFRDLYPNKSDRFISEIVNDYKKDMGDNIVSRFSSFFSDDEDLYCLILNGGVFENYGFFQSFIFSTQDYFQWVVCVTNQKILAFSQGLLGTRVSNQTVKRIPLKDIQSVQGVTPRGFVKLQVGQSKYSFHFGDDREIAHLFLEALNKRLDALSEMNTTVQPPPTQQPVTDNTLNQLERLAQLYQQGILTEQEFQIQKQKILDNH